MGWGVVSVGWCRAARDKTDTTCSAGVTKPDSSVSDYSVILYVWLSRRVTLVPPCQRDTSYTTPYSDFPPGDKCLVIWMNNSIDHYYTIVFFIVVNKSISFNQFRQLRSASFTSDKQDHLLVCVSCVKPCTNSASLFGQSVRVLSW